MFPALFLYIHPKIQGNPGSTSTRIMYVDESSNIVVSTVILSAGTSAGKSLQESGLCVLLLLRPPCSSSPGLICHILRPFEHR